MSSAERLHSTTYWQVAAGAAGRDYTDLFLRWGMAFVGGSKQLARMREVESGDVIVLKRGLSTILAAGPVVEREGEHRGEGDRPWLEDVDGWSLPGYCHVDWHVAEEPVETSGLKRTAIQKAPNEEHRRIADELIATRPVHPREPEPEPTTPVPDDEILRFLVERGLRPADADDLVDAFRRIRLLVRYYMRTCRSRDIGEQEVRSFLLTPLLLALGWSEQQMKMEWPCTGGRIDIACFDRPQHESFREARLLLEAKDISKGLDYAAGQVRNYARSFPDCRVLVVTNGYCYKAYLRDEEADEFHDTPAAYLNILRPRDRYPLDPERVDGALGVLGGLMAGTG